MRGVGKFVSLPLFSGCASRSSVATAASASATQFQEPKAAEINPIAAARRHESEDRGSADKMKSSNAFLVLPNRSYISNGVHKLVRSLKNFSQLFVFKKEEEEEEEVNMEIGYPTDVKHVTHIGLDGSTNTNTIKGWENLNNFVPPEILSFPSISLRHFELSMAAQSQQQPLVDVQQNP